MLTTNTSRRTDMTTFSGVCVCFDDLENLEVRPEDIYRATSNICRYNGHLDWKLVRHLALCATLGEYYLAEGNVLDPLTPAYAAMHDFHEAYVTDIPAGLKKYIPDYCAIELKAETRVHEWYGMPLDQRNDRELGLIDKRALVCEMWALGHPAAASCADYYGGKPSEDELGLMTDAYFMSTEQAWERANYTLLQGLIQR